MTLLRFFLLLVYIGELVTIDTPWERWDWCKEALCPLKKHVTTVCWRKHKCNTSPNCTEFMLSDKQRDYILDLHNRYRNKVGLGLETVNGMAGASNMKALSYDRSLEYDVRCHMNRCYFEHDDCRSTKRWLEVGQNLYVSTDWRPKETAEQNINRLLKIGVDAWYEEVNIKGVDFSKDIDNFQESYSGVGHFTQMIWGATQFMGCHFNRDKYPMNHEVDASLPGESVLCYVSCNYGRAGNAVGRPMFRRGENCSDCPWEMKCNKKYPGLCGEILTATDITAGRVLINKIGTKVVGKPFLLMILLVYLKLLV